MNNARNILDLFKKSGYIENFIPRTTPSTTTFCPNCYATGRNWHPNGDWSWSSSNPEVLICNVCKMQFPNEKYPETLRIKSTWDPEQEFSYVDNGPVQCMYYKVCRSSIDSVIRGKKLNSIISSMNSLALGYFVSGNSEFAIYVKKALMRLSEVLPKYLVYAGYSYSEYCDVDPHEAVKDPSKVTKFIFAPGNEEKTGLYAGYWAASRLGTSGMDGMVVKTISEAFDWTADAKDEEGNPIYSESDKEIIKKNCLVESALLGFYDTSINNKAVYNRQGVASVGLATGSTLMTRFGLEGFLKTFTDWYLPDGGTPESASYNIMAIKAIYTYGYSFRDYSDPIDFVPPDGEVKYSHFNANRDTIFDEVWQDLLWTTNGDFTYPPIADTYAVTHLPINYIDYLSMAYNTTTVLSYVNERSPSAIPYYEALFYRDPTIDLSSYGQFNFPDIVFPYLSQGFLRSGEYGKKSTIVMDASDFGAHHHFDSLNIVYKKDGRELMNDLGYLWDHPNHSITRNTNIHNTVFIDHQNQVEGTRNGSFHLFSVHGNVKAMQASSNAYKNANVYNRTIVQIEHKSGKNYIVDIFRAAGGRMREYVFHGVHHNYTMNPNLVFDQPYELETNTGVVRIHLSKKGYIEISNVLLRKKFRDGTYGENMMSPLPDIFTSLGCPPNGTWCHYRGNGYFTWNVTRTAPNNEKAVHFKATTPSDTGAYNIALNLGNCNGYICPPDKGFNFDINSIYEIEFIMRGTVTPTVGVQYWTKGEEMSSSGRKNHQIPEFKNINVGEEWKRFVGTISMNKANILGCKTDKELIIKWDIDDNYTFSSFIPKRDPQMIFYEEGFGQRDHKNSDFGVTVPNFDIFRYETNETSTFVNVFEGNYKDEEIVKNVEIIESNNGNVAIQIQTKEGNDFILSSFDGEVVNGYSRSSDGRLAIDIEEDPNSVVMFDGSFFQFPRGRISSKVKSFNGRINGYFNEKSDSWFKISGDNLDLNSINKCQFIFTTGKDEIERAYPIMKVVKNDDGSFNIFTRVGSEGFRTHESLFWRLTSIGDSDNFDNSSEVPSESGKSSESDESVISGESSESAESVISGESSESSESAESVISGESNESGESVISGESNESGELGESGKSGLSSVAIAGIVIAVILVVAAVVGGFFFYKKRKVQSDEIINSSFSDHMDL